MLNHKPNPKSSTNPNTNPTNPNRNPTGPTLTLTLLTLLLTLTLTEQGGEMSEGAIVQGNYPFPTLKTREWTGILRFHIVSC